ncbi:MAG: hypothetical protein Q9217_001504 [Psora testacea]
MIYTAFFKYLFSAWAVHVAVIEVQRFNSGLELYDPSSISAGVISVLLPSLPTIPRSPHVVHDHYASDASEGSLAESLSTAISSTGMTDTNATGQNISSTFRHHETETTASNDTSTSKQKLHTRPRPPNVIRILAAALAFFEELTIRSLFLKAGVISALIAAWILLEQQKRISSLECALISANRTFQEEKDADRSALESAKQGTTNAIPNANARLEDTDSKLQWALASEHTMQSQLNDSRYLLTNATRKADTLEQRLSDSQQMLATVRGKVDDLQLRLDDSQEVLETANDRAGNLQKQLEDSQDALATATGRAEKLEAELADSYKAIKAANGAMRTLETRLNISQSAKNGADERIRELEVDLTLTRKAKDTATGRVRLLEMELQASNDCLDDANTRIGELEHSLHERTVDATASRTRIEELERQQLESSSTTSSLQSQLQESKDQTKDAAEKAETYADLLNKATASFTPLSKRVSDAEKAAKLAEGKAENLKREVARLEHELDGVSTSFQLSKADLEQRADELSVIQLALQQERDMVTELNARLAQEEKAHEKAWKDEASRHEEVEKELKASLDKTVRCTDCKKMYGLEKSFEEWDIDLKASEAESSATGDLTRSPRRRSSVASSESNSSERLPQPKLSAPSPPSLPVKKSTGPEPSATSIEAEQTAPSSSAKSSDSSPQSKTSTSSPQSKPADSSPPSAPSTAPAPSISLTSPSTFQVNQPTSSQQLNATAAPFTPISKQMLSTQQPEQPTAYHTTSSQISHTPPSERPKGMTPQIEPHHQAYRLLNNGGDVSGVKNTMKSLDDERDPELFTNDKELKEIIKKREEERKAEKAQKKIDINEILSPPLITSSGMSCIKQTLDAAVTDSLTAPTPISTNAPQLSFTPPVPTGPKLSTPLHQTPHLPASQTLAPNSSAPGRIAAYTSTPATHTQASHQQTPPTIAAAGFQSHPIPHHAQQHRSGLPSSVNESFQRQFGNINPSTPSQGAITPSQGATTPSQGASRSRQRHKPQRNQMSSSQATKGAMERMAQLLGK